MGLSEFSILSLYMQSANLCGMHWSYLIQHRQVLYEPSLSCPRNCEAMCIIAPVSSRTSWMENCCSGTEDYGVRQKAAVDY